LGGERFNERIFLSLSNFHLTKHQPNQKQKHSLPPDIPSQIGPLSIPVVCLLFSFTFVLASVNQK
jgi:hypothetical protein